MLIFSEFFQPDGGLTLKSAFNPSGLQARPMNPRMLSVPYIELEKKHEGRFFSNLSHMADQKMPLNYEGSEVWGQKPITTESHAIPIPYNLSKDGA